jgi:hypothetical protein
MIGSGGNQCHRALKRTFGHSIGYGMIKVELYQGGCLPQASNLSDLDKARRVLMSLLWSNENVSPERLVR